MRLKNLLHAGGPGRLSMTRWDLEGVRHFDFDVGAKSTFVHKNRCPSSIHSSLNLPHMWACAFFFGGGRLRILPFLHGFENIDVFVLSGLPSSQNACVS